MNGVKEMQESLSRFVELSSEDQHLKNIVNIVFATAVRDMTIIVLSNPPERLPNFIMKLGIAAETTIQNIVESCNENNI